MVNVLDRSGSGAELSGFMHIGVGVDRFKKSCFFMIAIGEMTGRKRHSAKLFQNELDLFFVFHGSIPKTSLILLS